MKSELDLVKGSEQTFDALLDEINKQKRLITQLQTESRALKTNEIRLNRASEAVKTENLQLTDEVAKLSQLIRELEIQLTIPTNERTFVANRVIDPFPRLKWHQSFNWAYILVPVLALAGIAFGKWWGSQSAATAIVDPAAVTASVGGATEKAQTPLLAATPVNANPLALEEGYLVVDNPLDKEEPVRLRDGFDNKAREVAFVDPGVKFKIRNQSPAKMQRTVLLNGKSTRIEDYFYKISDKDQWIFGFFTNRRTYTMPVTVATPAAVPVANPATIPAPVATPQTVTTPQQ
jgi:hypothetical protein